MYEHRGTPPLPRRRFVLRLLAHLGVASALVLLSLIGGMWGYEHYEALPWRDAFLMLAPALVQCRAAHPDSWHEKVRATPKHPGLTAIPDSCYMWRRGGTLQRNRGVV